MSHRRIRFYSDDSYAPCGGKRAHAVIGGVALSEDRTNVCNQLLSAENISGKGQFSDWCRTRPRARADYIDAVLAIPALRGRVFFRAYESLTASDYWPCRVQTLTTAINVFTPGNCHHEMFHEGLKGGPRFQLRCELKKEGCDRVTVETAMFIALPEVRLSDALAGYIRGELFRGDGQRASLTNLPDWFVDLDSVR